MAEGKYGRLFTEADLALAAIYAATRALGLPIERSPDGKLLAVVSEADEAARDALTALKAETLTFPADEPLFLLRASEPGAVNLLAAIYNSDEFNDGAGYIRDRAHYSELVHLQYAFADWSETHPDRAKAPD